MGESLPHMGVSEKRWIGRKGKRRCGGDRGEGGLGLPRHSGEGALTNRSLAVTGAAWRAFVGAAAAGPTLPPLLRRSPPPTLPNALVNHRQAPWHAIGHSMAPLLLWEGYPLPFMMYIGWVGGPKSQRVVSSSSKLQCSCDGGTNPDCSFRRTKFRFDNWLNATVQARTFDYG